MSIFYSNIYILYNLEHYDNTIKRKFLQFNEFNSIRR